MTVFGTRPEAIKMAPIVLELQKHPDTIVPVVAVTAQHREMLDQVLNLFHIKPDHDLNIMAAGQTLFDITTRAMMGLDKVLTEEKPDIVLVHGDTTTTFAGALVAYYHQTAVGHVEAGLRTHNKYSPFPEEMNRRLTGCIADLNFAPTSTSEANLLAENVPPESIFVTGNTVIDALHHTVRDDFDFQEEARKDVDFQKDMGIIIETPGFIPYYSGYKNLKLLAGLNNKIGKEEIKSSMKQVGLDPDLKRHVRKYSLGSRQRLGLAQAIMENPKLLILDEPFKGLDKDGVKEMREYLLSYKEQGKTILICSHSAEDISVLCDTVHEMDKGVIEDVR